LSCSATGSGSAASARILAIPGVREAGVTTKLPLNGGTNGSYLVEGEKYDAKAPRPLVERSWVTSECFGAMGIPLRAGRLFTAASAPAKSGSGWPSEPTACAL